MNIKITGILPVVTILTLLIFPITACNSGEKKSGDIKVGTECKDIGPATGKFACVDNNMLFCSSFTGYKFKVQNKCKDDQVCTIAPGGKSASCKPK